MSKVFQTVFLSWLVLTLAPSAYSCTCDPQSEKPLCTVAPNDLPTAIFVGTVFKLNKELVPDNIEFSVTEPLRGQVGSTFKLTSGGGSCDVDFAVGRTYLVLAKYSSSGRLWFTSICLRTHLLTAEPEFVDPDLRTLRALRDHTPLSGWVYGWVYPLAEQTVFPQSRVPIVFTSGGKEHRVLTDSKGRYSIKISLLSTMPSVPNSQNGIL